MKLREKLCALISRALRSAEQKNHELAEKNRLKSAISRAEHGRDLAYTNLGKYYYSTGKADAYSRQYFERIERSNARIEKARALLRTSAEESRRKKQQTPPIPPALKLELETEAIVSQIERETDAILLAQTPEQKEPRSQEEAQQLKAVAAPPEECALENDCNIPWE